MLELISAVEAEGPKGKVAVVVGGAAVTREEAEQSGVLYGKTREDAVALAKKL
jgi:methanogenic corrinoid protein MtbC1